MSLVQKQGLDPPAGFPSATIPVAMRNQARGTDTETFDCTNAVVVQMYFYQSNNEENAYFVWTSLSYTAKWIHPQKLQGVPFSDDITATNVEL